MKSKKGLIASIKYLTPEEGIIIPETRPEVPYGEAPCPKSTPLSEDNTGAESEPQPPKTFHANLSIAKD